MNTLRQIRAGSKAKVVKLHGEVLLSAALWIWVSQRGVEVQVCKVCWATPSRSPSAGISSPSESGCGND